MSKPNIKVTCEVVKVESDPSMRVTKILIIGDNSEWPEVLGSACEVKAYLLGLRAMAGMFNRQDIAVEIPGVPREMYESF